jgi:hypothetical protein
MEDNILQIGYSKPFLSLNFSGKLSNRVLTAVLIALFVLNAILLFFYL